MLTIEKIMKNLATQQEEKQPMELVQELLSSALQPALKSLPQSTQSIGKCFSQQMNVSITQLLKCSFALPAIGSNESYSNMYCAPVIPLQRQSNPTIIINVIVDSPFIKREDEE